MAKVIPVFVVIFYHPIGILPDLLKYLKDVYICWCQYFMMVFSKNHCEDWKCFSAQHCFLTKLEKWKQCFDNKKVFLTLKTDISKAYVAKLNAYDVEWRSLKLIKNYLNNRKQRVKINTQFSSRRDVLAGVLQELHSKLTKLEPKNDTNPFLKKFKIEHVSGSIV